MEHPTDLDTQLTQQDRILMKFDQLLASIKPIVELAARVLPREAAKSSMVTLRHIGLLHT